MRFRYLRIPAALAILGFLALSVERFVFGNLLARANQTFTTTDLIYGILILALPIALPITFKRLRRSKWLADNFFGISITMALLLGAILGYIVWDKQQQASTAIIVAATLATVGWLTQQAHSENLQRKQHTLNILVQMRQSPILNKHQINILAHFPYGTVVNEKDVAQLIAARSDEKNYAIDEAGNHKFPVIDSIYYVANFYEFLASGIKEGDIDKGLLRESMRTVIDRFYKKVEHVLAKSQLPDAKGRPTTGVFNNYYELINSWDD